LVNQPCVQVGVNRHLLAGHSVQREACGDLRHAPRAVGDDHKLHHHQNQERHHAHHEVAPDHELPEGFDDLARAARAQNQLRSDDAQRQPKQRRHQQQRGEHRELQRVGDVDRHQRNHDGRGEVEHDEGVQHPLRHGQNQHRDDDQDCQRNHQVGVAQRPCQPSRPRHVGFNCRRVQASFAGV
jgi:hypothetical protein